MYGIVSLSPAAAAEEDDVDGDVPIISDDVLTGEDNEDANGDDAVNNVVAIEARRFINSKFIDDGCLASWNATVSSTNNEMRRFRRNRKINGHIDTIFIFDNNRIVVVLVVILVPRPLLHFILFLVRLCIGTFAFSRTHVVSFVIIHNVTVQVQCSHHKRIFRTCL